MDVTFVKLYILENEDEKPRCARMPCEGVATLGQFRALLENMPSPILWPFDFYDAELKCRIATECEQGSLLKSYDHEVTVIRSDDRLAMVKESMALLEPTTVKVFPDVSFVYSADDKHEVIPLASTVSKAHAVGEDEHEEVKSEPTACEDEHEEASCPKADPKHKVFLSHSGAEKSFVRKLCKLLEEHDHYPFFDQWDDSLPKGKKFADLIFAATKKCLVAVVVLSEGYLSSKWPMIELAQFVRARKSGNQNLNLLPLFYKTAVVDLEDTSINDKWMPKWKELARMDPRVNPKVWAEAVRELRRWKGLEFHGFEKSNVAFPAVSETKEDYRDAIVKAIFKLAPPDLFYDMSRIHGGNRLCKILENKFQPHPKTVALVLGLYGMGGLGKTTISKCLCNYFNQEFLGRVCYIEMEDGKDALLRQKIVMRKLLRLVEPVMQNICNASQGWDILKRRMKLEKPVFLVIDNVGPDEEEEALEYLNLEYNMQSKILVVSRSLDVVGRLLGNRSYCCETPRLEKLEAVEILLQQGSQNLEYSSLNRDERGVVEGLVEEAWFQDQDLSQTTSWRGDKGGQYHPLALRALGAYLQKKNETCGVLSWATYKEKYRRLIAIGEPYNKLFKILGLQFSTLDKTKQLMYLDIVLYAPSAFQLPMLSNSPLEDIEIWLATIHNVARAVVKHRISYFSELALLNIERENIIVHDLYKEYAKWALKNVGNSGEVVGVWCDGTLCTSIPEELQRSPSGRCWQELRRIRLHYLSFYGFSVTRFQEWQNVVVLQIIRAYVTTLNFQGLTCLRHLELRGLGSLHTLILTGDGSTFHDTASQASCVEPKQYFPRPWLQYVVLEWLSSLKFLSSFSSFTSLKYLKVVGCGKLRDFPRVQHCSKLEQMQLQLNVEQNTSLNLDGLTSLQYLTICGLGSPRKGTLKLEGLNSLSSLRALSLKGIPVGGLDGLENLTNVEYICLSDLFRLEDLSPLESLASSSLRELDVFGCGEHMERLKLLQLLISQNLEGLAPQEKCVSNFSNCKILVSSVSRFKSRLHEVLWRAMLKNAYPHSLSNRSTTCSEERP